MPSTFVISPLTRDHLEAARIKLADQGLDMGSDSGVIVSHGVTLTFSYNGADALTITVDHKPLLYPEKLVESKIRDWFGEL